MHSLKFSATATCRQMAALHDMSALGFAGLNYSTGCLFRKNHSGHLASDEWKRIASDCVLLLVAKARLGQGIAALHLIIQMAELLLVVRFPFQPRPWNHQAVKFKEPSIYNVIMEFSRYFQNLPPFVNFLILIKLAIFLPPLLEMVIK